MRESVSEAVLYQLRQLCTARRALCVDAAKRNISALLLTYLRLL